MQFQGFFRGSDMTLKLKEWASIAEIIGAVAVIVSLIYVGVQVNDSASAVRAASANDANIAVQNWYLQVGSDQQTSELFYQSITSDEPLSAEKEFQFLMTMHAAFLSFQNSHFLAQEGTIDRDLHEALTSAILGVKDMPGTGRYWRQRKSYLHPEFVEYVDGLLEQETNPSMDIYQPEEFEQENKQANG
jgi:hypothetical protein